MCGGVETRSESIFDTGRTDIRLLEARRAVCGKAFGGGSYRSDEASRAAHARARANIRFKFQAMVTRLHSPRTFSSPRREN